MAPSDVEAARNGAHRWCGEDRDDESAGDTAYEEYDVDESEDDDTYGPAPPTAEERRAREEATLSEGLLARIKRNDPGATSLIVDWRRNALAEFVNWENDEWRCCFGNNTHLEKIKMNDVGWTNEWEATSPRFKAFFRALAHNRSVRILHINLCNLSEEDVASNLCEFIEWNGNLSELEILFTLMSPSLATALSRRKNKQSLRKIYLGDCDSEDRTDLIIHSLIEYPALVKILFGDSYLGGSSCVELAALLQNQGCRLKKLCLDHVESERAGWLAVVNALANNTTLRWLNLHSCNIDDQVATALGTVLATNDTLKYLDIGSTDFVTSAGWRGFSECLQSPNCGLEKISMGFSRITNEGIAAVGSALSNNSTLKSLESYSCSLVSFSGWRSFALCLRNPDSALEELKLGGNSINDEVMSAFADTLVYNTSLRRLVVSKNSGLTTVGWAALANALCNTSSIEAICSSNHVLCGDLSQFYYDYWNFSDFYYEQSLLVELLELNEGRCKIEVSRRKVIQYYFLEGSANLNDFIGMELAMLPRAMAWSGRNNVGHSLLYKVLRGVPSLFDFRHEGAAPRSKRKREC